MFGRIEHLHACLAQRADQIGGHFDTVAPLTYRLNRRLYAGARR